MKLTNRRMNNTNQTNVLAEMAKKEEFEALLTRKYNNESIVNYLKTNADYKISLKDASCIPSSLGRLGYVAGSLVGIITNVFAVASVLMSKEYNQQFCYPGTDIIDLDLLLKVFVDAGRTASVDGYEECFMEGENIILVENKQGRLCRLARALKSDIQTFATKISNLRKITQDDLVKIGQDLEKIGRVMQELEIDSAKKPTIKDGILALDKFMNVYGCKLASTKMGGDGDRAIHILNNFDELIEAKNNKQKLPAFQYEIESFEVLADAKTKIAEQIEFFKKSNPEATEDELATEAFKIKSRCINQCYIVDKASVLKREIIASQKEELQQLVKYYTMSDMALFEQFKTAYAAKVGEINATRDEDNKITAEQINTMRKMCIIAINMINDYFRLKSIDVQTLSIDELASKLRSALFLKGLELFSYVGDESDDALELTFLIAAECGWNKIANYRGQDKITLKKRYSYKALSLLFTMEFKNFFNPTALYVKTNVNLPVGAEIELDSFISFENGEAEITLENGKVGTAYVGGKSDLYTGDVLVTVEDNDVVFYKLPTPYEFDADVDFILLDNTVRMENGRNVLNIETEGNSKEKFEAASMPLNSVDIEGADYTFVSESFKAFNDFVKIAVTTNDIQFKNLNNHLYIINRDKGVAAILGKYTQGLEVRDRLDSYNDVISFPSLRGALIVLKK